MKYKTTIEKFIELANVTNYKDDLYSDIYYEYEKLSIDDIVRQLPAKYLKSTLLKEKLALLPSLKDTLERALNSASYDALVSACYDKQNDALQEYADKLVELINKIPESGKDAVNSIIIDWKQDEVTIDFDTTVALATTREIINGEGMFVYDSDSELAMINDGKYKPAQAVIDHLHYLLNGKKINSIWGFTGRTRWNELDWECYYGSITDELTCEHIEEECNESQLSFLKGEIDGNVLYAVELTSKQKDAKELVEKTTELLSTTVSQLSAEDKVRYENLIK